MYDITFAREEPFASCVPSWALLGKCDGVLRARLHLNENYPFAMRLTWPRGMEGWVSSTLSQSPRRYMPASMCPSGACYVWVILRPRRCTVKRDDGQKIALCSAPNVLEWRSCVVMVDQIHVAVLCPYAFWIIKIIIFLYQPISDRTDDW